MQQTFFEERPIFCKVNDKIVVFEAPFGESGATYAVHLRLFGKLVGDLLLVIIELFSLGVFVFSCFYLVIMFSIMLSVLHIRLICAIKSFLLTYLLNPRV